MLYLAQICQSNQTCISFTQRPVKFKYTFAVVWLIPKENSSYYVLNFHLVWNTSRYKRLYVCLFVFMVLFCSSFGSRSKGPCALQLLIKMLIRWCLMWEGLVFLYRNFVFKTIYLYSTCFFCVVASIGEFCTLVCWSRVYPHMALNPWSFPDSLLSTSCK